MIPGQLFVALSLSFFDQRLYMASCHVKGGEYRLRSISQ